ncbi:hypothetical protein BEN47_17055 [Hymenobacter lapidarius]|uniref:Uncharacterized protein n=1 Tax=Hymenobacter lapidarius TaxID=1908237 RepID=A0A1G1SZ95_9BACT|nr:hypothetical protein [Hymenobacter lapidarius]OGX83937.1 hypothetical protein BEN47_17055 [Hymenobacter lapidarius]
MRHLTSLLRRLTAVTFLVTYLGVFAGQAFCIGTGDPFAESGRAACCVGNTTAKGKDAKSPDCNKRGIARLLAAQDAPQAHSFLIAAPALLPDMAVFLPSPRFVRWSRTQKVALVPTRYLPPKIPDIRIFLHSLTV